MLGICYGEQTMSAQLGAIIVMSVGCIYVLVIGVGYKAIIEGKKAAVKA